MCFPSGEILNEFLLGAHAKYSIGINPSSEKRWVEYEEIQSDIFDHLLASISQFDLKVYQYPTGNDIKNSGLPK